MRENKQANDKSCAGSSLSVCVCVCLRESLGGSRMQLCQLIFEFASLPIDFACWLEA